MAFLFLLEQQRQEPFDRDGGDIVAVCASSLSVRQDHVVCMKLRTASLYQGLEYRKIRRDVGTRCKRQSARRHTM